MHVRINVEGFTREQWAALQEMLSVEYVIRPGDVTVSATFELHDGPAQAWHTVDLPLDVLSAILGNLSKQPEDGPWLPARPDVEATIDGVPIRIPMTEAGGYVFPPGAVVTGQHIVSPYLNQDLPDQEDEDPPNRWPATYNGLPSGT
jgi:hypothetical protein